MEQENEVEKKKPLQALHYNLSCFRVSKKNHFFFNSLMRRPFFFLPFFIRFFDHLPSNITLPKHSTCFYSRYKNSITKEDERKKKELERESMCIKNRYNIRIYKMYNIGSEFLYINIVMHNTVSR